MIKNCLQCNKEFNVKPSRALKGVVKFCSSECMGLSKKGVTPKQLIGKQFVKGQKATGTPFKKGHKGYIHPKGLLAGNKNPNYKGGNVDVNCAQCNESITKKRGQYNANENKRFFCSNECYDLWRHINLAKENAYCYKQPEDRITPKNKALRETFEGREWKKSCKFRDNFMCIICGSNEILQIHHIKSFTRFPELRFDIDNGATLCKKHHTEFHRKYGLKKFTSDDFYEFLKTNV